MNIFPFSALLLPRTLSEDEAGNREGRIAGGSLTTIQDHPYQVSVRRHGLHICGGAIISTARVLTSACCINPSASPQIYSILAGTTDRTDECNGQLRNISKFTRYPDYTSKPLENDIAILELETPLKFDNTIARIALPPHNLPDIPDGALVTVTGWGYHYNGSGLSIKLRALSMPVISNGRCHDMLGEKILPSMMCAANTEEGASSCTGDNGGPLLFQGMLYGIMSRSSKCGQSNDPALYTRVPYFTRWIQNFI